MSSPVATRVLSSLALLSSVAFSQTYVDLDFSNNVQPALEQNPNGSTLGPWYHSGSYLDFTNAGSYNGTSIDVRVSVAGLIDGEGPGFRDTSTYQWVGWLPSYNNSAMNDDLGVYYRHDGNPLQQSGGVAWTMSFYESGSDFSTPITLPGVRMLVYDHDGELYQSESIRTFAGDGFAGYQLHDGSGIHVHDEDGSYRFDSRGLGLPETTAEGGMILYYHNTSSIRFDMFATTLPQLPGPNNGIFAAWDGNLGVNNGGTSGFGEFVPVPEPTAPLLIGVASITMLMRRSRPSA